MPVTPLDPLAALNLGAGSPPRRETTPIGTLGHYTVFDVRRGGMGEVYICETQHVGKGGDEDTHPYRVALKTFQKRLFFNPEARHAFAREAALWIRLSGEPHIMPAFGLERINDRLFIRMLAAIPGPRGEVSLRDLLRDGPLPPSTALCFALQVALGLRSADWRVSGILHGDLKPENLLLMGSNLFISDFGLARVVEEAKGERLESTWAYLAPECWSADAGVTQAADVYAFGVVLHEMLVGRTPFAAKDRDGWRRAHVEARPVLEVPPEDGLVRALGALAEDCLRKDPGTRPAGFQAIVERLGAIGDGHDTLNSFVQLVESIKLAKQFATMRESLKPVLIKALLSLDEAELALQELEAIPEPRRDATLDCLRGDALSRLGRDEEAVPAFVSALAKETKTEERHVCLSFYALTLKRLGRLAEAERIYRELLLEAGDDMMPVIVTNLATVLLAKGDTQAVVDLLENYIRCNPSVPQVWANLSLAYKRLGRYEDAAERSMHALALAPSEPQLVLTTASLLMEHVGRLEEAFALLDGLFAQGHTSQRWFVLFYSCCILLGREKIAGQLVAEVRRNLDEAAFSALMRKVNEHVQTIMAGGTPAAQSANRNDAERPSPPVGRARNTEAANAPLLEPEQAAPRPPVSGAFPKVPFPHIRFRTYSFFDMTIDYYNDLEAPHYVSIFAREWRRVRRDPMFKIELRAASFYFTRCPACGTLILTNRDEGKNLACEACGARNPISRLQDEALDARIAEIETVLGLKRGVQRFTLALLAQTDTEAKIANIDVVCGTAGFRRAYAGSGIELALLKEGRRRGRQMMDGPTGLWLKVAEVALNTPFDATPTEVGRLIREILSVVSPLHTMSAVLPAEMAPLLIDDASSRAAFLAELEEEYFDAVVDRPDDPNALANLVNILTLNQKLDEAREKAIALTRLRPAEAEGWIKLGRIEMFRESFPAALAALERAIELNPLDSLSLSMAASACDRLGRQDRAASFMARL